GSAWSAPETGRRSAPCARPESGGKSSDHGICAHRGRAHGALLPRNTQYLAGDYGFLAGFADVDGAAAVFRDAARAVGEVAPGVERHVPGFEALRYAGPDFGRVLADSATEHDRAVSVEHREVGAHGHDDAVDEQPEREVRG